MDVILLERVGKLGNLGDVVQVKDGYARNFLLPAGKALRANKANREKFEAERAAIEALNAEKAQSAGSEAGKLDGQSFILIRQAGEAGQLYGSVSPRDIAEAATSESGIAVNRNQVQLETPIKLIGLHDVRVALHAEVDATITINVARSQDEAEAQARGEVITEEDDGEYDALAAAEALLNEEEDDDAEAEEAKAEEAKATEEAAKDDETSE